MPRGKKKTKCAAAAYDEEDAGFECMEEELPAAADEARDNDGPFMAPVRLMCQSPEIAKVVLAGGLQQAAVAVANMFCISVLQGKIWGINQASYASIIGVVINIIASIAGGPFGRFSDKIDRRIAFMIFAVGSFLPSWTLLLLGMNERSLWASQIALILGSAPTAANVPMAMLTDVTSPQDREIATGAYFAFSNLVSFIFNALPALFFNVLKVPGSATLKAKPHLFLFYSCALASASLLCMGVITATKVPSEDPGEDLPKHKLQCCSAVKEFIKPMQLVAHHTRLRPLCFSAFLLAFSGTLVMCVGGTYYNQSLGLLPYGTDEEFQDVQLLTLLPGQLLVLPGYVLTAYLAKAGGTLKLMRNLIPITSGLLLLGILLKLFPHFWFLPVVVIAESYTGLTNVPLMRLIAGVAPPGRTGEALSAVGVTMQVAGFVGNLIVAGPGQYIVHWASDTFKFQILWAYYPVCALIHLAALLPIMGKPKSGRWGAASGLVERMVERTNTLTSRVSKTLSRSNVRVSPVRSQKEEYLFDNDDDNSSDEESSDVSTEPEAWPC